MKDVRRSKREGEKEKRFGIGKSRGIMNELKYKYVQK
jgi:hypothetical protein